MGLKSQFGGVLSIVDWKEVTILHTNLGGSFLLYVSYSYKWQKDHEVEVMYAIVYTYDIVI